MRSAATIALVTTIVACLALLVSCGLAWAPGGTGLVACPVLFVVATYVIVALIRARAVATDDAARTRARVARRSAVTCTVLVIGTFVLVILDVPVRIAFAIWHGEFERAAERYDPDAPWDLVGERVGPYTLNGVALDERGGLYLRVREEQGLLEMYSYGFARDANDEGTPFGNAGYSPTRLAERWAWFSVNDDW